MGNDDLRNHIHEVRLVQALVTTITFRRFLLRDNQRNTAYTCKRNLHRCR